MAATPEDIIRLVHVYNMDIDQINRRVRELHFIDAVNDYFDRNGPAAELQEIAAKYKDINVVVTKSHNHVRAMSMADAKCRYALYYSVYGDDGFVRVWDDIPNILGRTKENQAHIEHLRAILPKLEGARITGGYVVRN